MPSSKCQVCGKPIAGENAGSRCDLCSIGLKPETSGQFAALYAAEGGVASGRVLSGTHCPDCRAELSLADISLKRCGICGEFISLESLNQHIQVRETWLPASQLRHKIREG